MGPARVVRRRIGVEQALIGIYVRRKQRGKVRHARLLPADKMAEGGCRLPRFVAEHVSPAGRLDHALVNMHRTAGRVRQRLGHAKRARGLMARYAADKHLARPQALKNFDVEGYAFDPADSDDKTWVFKRRLA